MKDKVKLFSFRKFVLALSDMFIIGTSALLSNYVISLFDMNILQVSNLTKQTFLTIVFSFVALWLCGAYTKMWRYFKAKDYLSCVLGTTFGVLMVLVFSWFGFFEIYGSMTSFYAFLIIEYIISTVGIVAFRLIFRKTF